MPVSITTIRRLLRRDAGRRKREKQRLDDFNRRIREFECELQDLVSWLKDNKDHPDRYDKLKRKYLLEHQLDRMYLGIGLT